MATISEHIEQLKIDKQTLVDNLVEKGVTATSNETFTTLVPKVKDIQAGDEELTNSFISLLDETDGANCTKIPDLINIGEYAFYSKSNLAFKKLPDSVVTIGSRAFIACTNMNLEKLSSNLTTIGESAFQNCKGLTSLDTVSTALSKIDTNAFNGCSNLTTLIVRATTPPTLKSQPFSATPIANGTGYIYVPDESVEAYKTSWSGYANQIKGISELAIE